MNELISSILDAEKKAEDMLFKAKEDLKNKKVFAVDNAEKIKYSAISSFKEVKSQEIAKAEKKAQEEYSKIVSDGENKATDLANSVKGNIGEVSSLLIKELIK